MAMEHFDYEHAAREAGLNSDQLHQLMELVRRDYPTDQMLFELHVLRACRAIAEGRTTFERAIASPAEASS